MLFGSLVRAGRHQHTGHSRASADQATTVCNSPTLLLYSSASDFGPFFCMRMLSTTLTAIWSCGQKVVAFVFAINQGFL